MPVARMRMRPWLEKMIESKCITGLAWVDKEKTMFSIPWKHAARHGWEMDKDACLFKKWAIHTGKYTEGQTCDPKTWKANFRCAMNSLPDIEEVKDKSVNKGQQAMRIFKMLPVTGKSRDKRRKAKAKLSKKNSPAKMEEDTDSDTQSLQNLLSELPQCSQKDNVSFFRVEIDTECKSSIDDIEISLRTSDPMSPSYCRRFQLSPPYKPDYCESMIENLQRYMDTYSGGLETILNMDPEISLSSFFTEGSSSDEAEENTNYTILDNVQTLSKSFMWSDID